MKFSDIPVGGLFTIGGDNRLRWKNKETSYCVIDRAIESFSISDGELETRSAAPSPEQIQMALDILGIKAEDLKKLKQ